MAMLAKVYNIPKLKRSGARRKSIPSILKLKIAPRMSHTEGRTLQTKVWRGGTA